MIPPMGQDTYVYVYVPCQIQKRGVLELLIAQRFELMVGIESRQASLTQNQGPTAPESPQCSHILHHRFLRTKFRHQKYGHGNSR